MNPCSNLNKNYDDHSWDGTHITQTTWSIKSRLLNLKLKHTKKKTEDQYTRRIELNCEEAWERDQSLKEWKPKKRIIEISIYSPKKILKDWNFDVLDSVFLWRRWTSSGKVCFFYYCLLKIRCVTPCWLDLCVLCSNTTHNVVFVFVFLSLCLCLSLSPAGCWC